MIMKPLRLAIVSILAAMLFLPSVRPAAAQATITLTYWRIDEPQELAIDNKIAATFMAQHPNIKIQISAPGLTDDLHQKLLVAFAGGGAPDIISVYNGYFPQYATLGFLRPIDYAALGMSGPAQFAKEWFPGALSAFTYKGQVYGVPNEVGNYLTVISPKLFRAAGLDPIKDAPRTWEDIARIGPKLTKVQNGSIVQQGYGITSYPLVMALVFDSMIHQLGGSITSADGSKAVLNSPAGVKVLQTLYDFVNKYKISVLAGRPLQGPGFANGTTAIITDVGLWYKGYLQTNGPKIYDNGKGLMFLPFPRFQGGKNLGGVTYGYAWAVSAQSQHPKEAWEFIKMLSAQTSVPYLTQTGITQPKVSMLTNPAVTSNPDLTLAFKELAAGMNYATLPEQVSDIIYAAVSHSILDKVSPKVALDQAAQQLDALLPTLPYKLIL